MSGIKYLCFFLLCIACSQDDVVNNEFEVNVLSDLVSQNDVQLDNVIACASGSPNKNEIIAYVYPRPGATNLRYFETADITVDKNDFSLYTQIDLPIQDFFNGYLKTFTRQTEKEKWVIISFRESDTLHISNPILLKHQTQNTLFTDEVAISQEQAGAPLFVWDNLANPDNAIYFQVVSDATNELLSGTYTFEEQFQFYNLSNVVLNITEQTPPSLIAQDEYYFTLMGVSEDNWVNAFGRRSFTVN